MWHARGAPIEMGREAALLHGAPDRLDPPCPSPPDGLFPPTPPLHLHREFKAAVCALDVVEGGLLVASGNRLELCLLLSSVGAGDQAPGAEAGPTLYKLQRSGEALGGRGHVDFSHCAREVPGCSAV